MRSVEHVQQRAALTPSDTAYLGAGALDVVSDRRLGAGLSEPRSRSMTS